MGLKGAEGICNRKQKNKLDSTHLCLPVFLNQEMKEKISSKNYLISSGFYKGQIKKNTHRDTESAIVY